MNRILFIIGLVIFASCHKSNEHKSPEPALVIDFKHSAINVTQIDSADVVFRKVGSDTKVKKRFSKSAEQLLADIKALTPGTWNADIEVYTKTVNQFSNQYVIIKPILVEEKMNGVQIGGPGATSGNGWLKRNVKSAPNNEVVLIIPEEVYDSYFEVRSKVNRPVVFGIQREAINVNHEVTDATFACNTECLKEGRYSNIDYFMPFTQEIMSKPWTRNDINISVLNDNLEELLFYERSWHQ